MNMGVERFMELRRLTKASIGTNEEVGWVRDGLRDALDALEQAEDEIPQPAQYVLAAREWAVKALLGIIVDAGQDFAKIRDADIEDARSLARVGLDDVADKLQEFTTEYARRNAEAHRLAEEHNMRKIARVLEVLR